MIEKKDFKYELGHNQFKSLIYEIQAIHSFNYEQFKKLTQISNHTLELAGAAGNNLIIEIVRDIMSFNFKQHKKLKRLVYTLNKILDPNWSPPTRARFSSNEKSNTLADQLPTGEKENKGGSEDG